MINSKPAQKARGVELLVRFLLYMHKLAQKEKQRKRQLLDDDDKKVCSASCRAVALVNHTLLSIDRSRTLSRRQWSCPTWVCLGAPTLTSSFLSRNRWTR